MPGVLEKLALAAIERKSIYFKPSSALEPYLRDVNIGVWKDGKVLLTDKAKTQLREYLLRDYKVPLTAHSKSWEGISRIEATTLGTNEKATRKAVRRERVAVKTFKGRPLSIEKHEGGVETFHLPDGMSLDVHMDDAFKFKYHKRIVVVENWEAFQNIHSLSFFLPEHLKDALVVYRGQKGDYPIKSARTFLTQAGCPVSVFCDPDPAGLMLSMNMPGFVELMLPPLSVLEDMLKAGRGDIERYTKQARKYENFLNACTQHDVQNYWRLFKKYGKAISQEEFCFS
jgi:hypothetical protein